MKKLLTFLFSSVLLAACTTNEEGPVIEVDEIIVNGDKDINYAAHMDKLPVLNVGDGVDIKLLLDGSGTDLKTFLVKTDDEMQARIDYRGNEVSNDPGFTDEEKGQLRFVDGVVETTLTVRATVRKIVDDTVKLSFYLSSQAECEGAQCDISLKTGEKVK